MSCRDLFRHCTKPCRLCTKTKNLRVRNTFHRISRDLLLNSFFSRLERMIRLVKKGTSTCYGSSEEREREMEQHSMHFFSFNKTLAFENQFCKISFMDLCCVELFKGNPTFDKFYKSTKLIWSMKKKSKRLKSEVKMKHNLRRIALYSLHSDCMWRVNDIKEHKTAIYGQGTSI